MAWYCDAFAGKSITILGLGLLGRAVGDAEFLARCGARLLVTDKKGAEELAPSIQRLEKFNTVSFRLGGHDKKDFVRCDFVLKAAGVPLDSPEIAAARAAGVPVMMSTALFASHAMRVGVTLVGVTGTRGKSTVAHMIYHSLARVNKRAILGGNIRGVSTLALLPRIRSGDHAVLELDSWQLQGFGDMKVSPHIAVFTNFMPDHLNYYKGNVNAYFADKANIFRFQRPNDVLIIGSSVVDRIRVAHPPIDPVVAKPIPRSWKLHAIGEHNQENAALAVAALETIGLSNDEIRSGIESFEPIEGRLQFVRNVNGVKIYNDNNATTPEATVAALRSLGKDIILIAGGADKGLDVNTLVDEIKNRCKKVFLLAGTGTDRIKKDLPGAQVFDALEQAVAAATATATAGDSILFSPAFASFGMFQNEYDRNDQFLYIIRGL